MGVVSQGRLGSGSRILASSLEETTRTSAQERPVGRTRWPRALTTWRHPPSPSSEYSTPSLSACSESSYPKVYSDDKQKASASYSLSAVQGIQQDMMQYGSVTGAFTVYEDFPTYTSGVYHHVSGSELGGHAIKIFGWGTEDGEDYWLVANSWNDQWGDHGTFKIRRGVNECGIEGQVSAGTVAASVVV